MRRISLCAVVIAAAAPGTWARPVRETVVYTQVPSSGILNSASNTVLQPTFVGGYSLGLITFSGTLTSLNSHTWCTDSRILVTAPGGATATIQPFTTGTTFTSLPFSGSIIIVPGSDPSGLWSFRFYESFADAGPGLADARWDITLNLTDDPPAPPSATDLGSLLAPGQNLQNLAVTNGAVRWFRFSLPWTINQGWSTYLDIDTVGSVIPPSVGAGLNPNDTQMALYSANGTLLQTDDDSGPGFTSQFSFGTGTRPAIGDGQLFDGRNGALPPGTYYLAIAPYRVAFGPSYWSATPLSSRNGTLALNLRTNLTSSAPICYANCDASTTAPTLNVLDFACFLNRFAAGDTYANCDASTTAPLLNVLDFACFLNRFAAGCS